MLDIFVSKNIGSKSLVKRNNLFITNGDNNSISISKRILIKKIKKKNKKE